jgi:predicted transcriptional regulator
MSTSAIISIKPVYANQILAGTKTIELRKSAMGLSEDDVILVYSSAPEQQLAFWFRIQMVESLSVRKMWNLHGPHLGIDFEDYSAYFNGLEYAVGFHVGEVQPIVPIPLKEIETLVEGFVPPQGIIWLRDDMGRFKALLSKLSTPLPDDVFAQQSLKF